MKNKYEFIKLMSLDHLENQYIPERKQQLKFLNEQAQSIRNVLAVAEDELLDRKTRPQK